MQKRPTTADIAKLAGVSSGAVSYALNGLPGVSSTTRQRILDIANDLGWRPNIVARGLSVSRAHSVGWVIARSLGIEPFFMRFITGLETELSASHTGLLLQIVDDHAAAIEAIQGWWAERRIDGVIVTDVWRDDVRIGVIDRLDIPGVLVGRPRTDSRLPAVWSDERVAVTSVVDYLVALGHRRIARVAGLRTLDHTLVRTAAFKTAMRRHKLDDSRVELTDYSPDQGALATRKLLTAPKRPTAISFDNDVMAVAALGVAREMGLAVPDDLSIVAGDDSDLCLLVNPTLTALSRDVAAYGAHAGRVLLEAIANKHPASYQDETSRLVVRASTASAPAPGRGP